MLEYQSEGGGGGDRTPVLKFDARDGSFILVDREQKDGKWISVQTVIDTPLQVAVDMDEMQVGYMAFMPNPDFRMVKVGEPMPPKPEERDENGKPLHKWGFRVRLCNKEIGLREVSSASKNVYDRMKALYAQYEAEKGANPGKVPVVEISGTERITQTLSSGQTQSWRVPVWNVTGWTERPKTLDGAAPPAAPAPAPAAVAPPVPAMTPAEAEAGADLF